MKNIALKNKIVLITGGTGSFGYAAVKRLLEQDLKEIRIYSRDEEKQSQMALFFQTKPSGSPILSFFPGDITDPHCLDKAMNGVDILIHAAAAKEVPFCEANPLEASRINIFGTGNVIECAVKHNVNKVIIISTDKACYPVGAMGISKAMMEKVAFSAAEKSGDTPIPGTSICIVRFGNLMGSAGTVVPIFVKQIKEGKNLTVTNPEMTRFMMTPDDAVDLTFCAILEGSNGDLIIQEAPSATLETLTKALVDLYGTGRGVKIEVMGPRPGEKLFETMATQTEMFKATEIPFISNCGNNGSGKKHLRIPLKGLNVNPEATEFNSHTSPVDREVMKSILTLL
ncbi:MAG: polysaccharide biosynthesis protein [Bacteroidales bacterium]|nr:polysaccharide biosynthesis protein [Bacteroidales bacterium]